MKSLKTAATSIAILALLSACSTGPARDESGAIVETGQIDAFSIKAGDCIEDPGADEEFSSLAAVPCSDPHASEAYHLFDLPDGVFPVGEAMNEAAAEGCLEAFNSFVGLDYEFSKYGVGWLEPSVDSWAQGDREIVCTLGDLEGELLVGSAKGTAI